MIKCDDIVRERDIASVCAIEFVQTGLFYACLAGRLDKYDALSVFFGLRTVFRGGLAVSIVSGAGFGFCVYEVRTGMVRYGYQ